MTEKKNNVNKPDDNSIRWIGLDGLLVLLIVVECIIGIIGLMFRVNFLSGYLFPGVLLIIVLTVTINYATTLGGFIRMQNEQAARAKAEQEKR